MYPGFPEVLRKGLRIPALLRMLAGVAVSLGLGGYPTLTLCISPALADELPLVGYIPADPELPQPWSEPPVEHVTPLPDLGSMSRDDYEKALNCLTSAVYYEAAQEPLSGQEAVAHVVLNRLKHPHYPKSVCGVVYQGSERRTGCQFTFTCDGSLARLPSTTGWRAAQTVAERALKGNLTNIIGTATHYHTSWVHPSWSQSLVNLGQIGAHIFYRFPGLNGDPSAFTGTYAGGESTIAPPPAPRERFASQRRHQRTFSIRAPQPTVFSGWGLTIASLTRHGDEVVINPVN